MNCNIVAYFKKNGNFVNKNYVVVLENGFNVPINIVKLSDSDKYKMYLSSMLSLIPIVKYENYELYKNCKLGLKEMIDDKDSYTDFCYRNNIKK